LLLFIFLYALATHFIRLFPLLLVTSSPSINKTNSETVFPNKDTTSGKKIVSGKFDWIILTVLFPT
jgi:hypothetical protein